MVFTHLSLFSGIGGLDLAGEMAGFKTVGQVEWADYPTKVLEKHWPDVPRWRDIRTLTKESFYEKTGLRTVDIVSGGFPCQPFSVAGKQKGKEDSRYLWPEMLRIIRELTPTWVLGENVPGILRIAGGTVVQDLEREGYDVAVFNFEAAAVGAPQRRARVFFVANREEPRGGGLSVRSRRPQQKEADANRCSETLGNTEGWREQINFSGRKTTRGFSRSGWWAVEPDVGRVANGVPNRMDRLNCLGNAVVPQQGYPLFAAIAAIESAEQANPD